MYIKPDLERAIIIYVLAGRIIVGHSITLSLNEKGPKEDRWI